MTRIKILLLKDHAILEQDADFGVFGTTQAHKELSYAELGKRCLHFVLLKITPHIDETKGLVQIVLDVELQPTAQPHVERKQPPTVKRVPLERAENMTLIGSVPFLRNAARENQVYDAEIVYYVRSYSTHSLIGISKPSFNQCWKKMRTFLLRQPKRCAVYCLLRESVNITAFHPTLTIARLFNYVETTTTRRAERWAKPVTMVKLTTKGATSDL